MNRRRILKATIVTATCCAGVFVVVWTPRPRSLLDHAEQIVSTKGWFLEHPGTNRMWAHRRDYEVTYHWISSNEVLFFKDVKNYVVKEVNRTIITRGPNSGELTVYDNSSRKERVLQSLTSQIKSLRGMPCPIEVSPNGNWLRWQPDGNIIYVASSLRDSSSISFPDRLIPHWIDNDKSLIEFDWSERDGISNCVFLDLGPKGVYKSTQILLPSIWETTSLPIVTESGRILCTSWHGRNGLYLSVNIYEIDSRSKPARLVTHTIDSPSSSEIKELEISRNGDRIAWLCKPVNDSWLSIFMRRVMRRQSVQSDNLLGLWVSRLDGSHMRCLGTLPQSTLQELIGNIHWVPDGKSLSFPYRGVLYRIPIGED